MSAPAYVLEGTERNFDQLVLENSRKDWSWWISGRPGRVPRYVSRTC